MVKIRKLFSNLPDPRAANATHDLLEIVIIALAAVLCGAQTATDMALFGCAKEQLLRQFLRLEGGIPSHDTFSRVFGALDPEAFEQAFRRFMAAFAKANDIKLTGVVAIDGKAVRGAYERGRSSTPLHMVNVFATEARMALAARKAPGRNEAQGALEVLGMLSLEGCIVTADALHCNRAFATTVLRRSAHYVLALKQNQSKLFEAVVRQFTRAGKRSLARSVELSTHDRSERRRATVLRNTGVGAANRFPGVVALARITSRRRLRGKPATSRPCITTCSPSTSRPNDCCRSCAVIGASRTNCIGCSTSFWRRRQSDQKEQRSGELLDIATGCGQHHPSPPRAHLDAPKGQARRLGRRLPPRPYQSYAIALPSRRG